MIHWSLKSSSTKCVLILPVRSMPCLEHSMWAFASNHPTWEHGSLGRCRREAGRACDLQVLVVSRKEKCSMEVRKIYVNDNEKGTLICEKCGKTRVINFS